MKRTFGSKLMMMMADTSRLEKAYPGETAKSILGNTKTHVFYMPEQAAGK